MKRFHHIVACLSLNDPDAGVLACVSNITRLADASRVSCVHAWQPVDIPPCVMERYPRLLEPGVQVAEERIEKLQADPLRESALAPTAIVRAVSEENRNLVTIGCRGHDAIYATLLGSKAGVFLLARLSPVLDGTVLWHGTLTILGGVTLLTGAGLGIVQHDLKRILAYTTLAVLGTLTMLIGVGTELALESLAVFLVGHAVYKAALFRVAGTFDHETGTMLFALP